MVGKCYSVSGRPDYTVPQIAGHGRRLPSSSGTRGRDLGPVTGNNAIEEDKKNDALGKCQMNLTASHLTTDCQAIAEV